MSKDQQICNEKVRRVQKKDKNGTVNNISVLL